MFENREVRQNLVELGKYLMANQLAWGNSGNMSARLNGEAMIITASGTYMGDLGIDDFSEVDIQSGKWVGDRKPSKEIPMHTSIYQNRPDAGVILHTSPFWSTLMACSSIELISELFIESMYYLENIEYVDYFHPGSEELGKAVGEKARKANVIFMKNHGIIVFDENYKEARMRIETLELTSKMIITARSANIELNRLPNNTVQDFLDNSGYKPRKRSH